MYISGDNLMLMSTFNKYDSKQGLDVSCNYAVNTQIHCSRKHVYLIQRK